LKAQFSSTPILRYFDPKLKTFLKMDASDFAITSILSQCYQGKLHPIAFLSRKMTPIEINYEIYDKEMLAIMQCFKQWRHYLEGAQHPVTVFTDHKNLEYFASTKQLNRCQAHWAEILSSFDFTIIYQKGALNGKADILSRYPEYHPRERGSVTQPVQNLFRPGQLQLDDDSCIVRISAISLAVLIESSHLVKDLLDEVQQIASNNSNY